MLVARGGVLRHERTLCAICSVYNFYRSLVHCLRLGFASPLMCWIDNVAAAACGCGWLWVCVSAWQHVGVTALMGG